MWPLYIHTVLREERLHVSSIHLPVDSFTWCCPLMKMLKFWKLSFSQGNWHTVLSEARLHVALIHIPVKKWNEMWNVYVYSLISHRVQHTSQFTPLVLELSLVRSHLLWENSAHFLQLLPFTILHCSFHQVPITAGWTEAAWYERLAQHLYTWPTAWLEHRRSPIQVLTGLGVA